MARPHLCPECGVKILAVEAEVDPRSIGHGFTAQCGHRLPAALTRDLWRDGMRWDLPAITGPNLGAAERHRQVHEEGFTAEHDAALDPHDLTWAAWCLLDAAASGRESVPDVPRMWPSSAGEWKPDHSRLRRLVIAQALIAAEVDRLLTEERAKGMRT